MTVSDFAALSAEDRAFAALAFGLAYERTAHGFRLRALTRAERAQIPSA